ncbi:hypothetical protein Chor_007729 [Crotalus horridus]
MIKQVDGPSSTLRDYYAIQSFLFCCVADIYQTGCAFKVASLHFTTKTSVDIVLVWDLQAQQTFHTVRNQEYMSMDDAKVGGGKMQWYQNMPISLEKNGLVTFSCFGNTS